MDFENMVILITGAGRGLGYEYARYFASKKANLVLNDLARTSDKYIVDFVAQALMKEFGNRIVTNHDSVEFGDKIVQTAIQMFGRIDVLINNAGILIDKSMSKTTSADFDMIVKVHVKGTFRCTLAAWPYFRKQKFGRVINTGSSSGIYGNFGQVNYSAAKAAIYGMSLAMSKEGENSNIKVNTIAPIAATGMTKGVMQEEILIAMNPKYVIPLVAVLASKDCPENGSLFECGAGWFTKLRYQRSEGLSLPLNATPEMIKENWNQVVDFSKTNDYPTSGSDSINRMYINYEHQLKLLDGVSNPKPKL